MQTRTVCKGFSELTCACEQRISRLLQVRTEHRACISDRSPGRRSGPSATLEQATSFVTLAHSEAAIFLFSPVSYRVRRKVKNCVGNTAQRIVQTVRVSMPSKILLQRVVFDRCLKQGHNNGFHQRRFTGVARQTRSGKFLVFNHPILDVLGDTQPQVTEAAQVTGLATNQCCVNGELI